MTAKTQNTEINGTDKEVVAETVVAKRTSRKTKVAVEPKTETKRTNRKAKAEEVVEPKEETKPAAKRTSRKAKEVVEPKEETKPAAKRTSRKAKAEVVEQPKEETKPEVKRGRKAEVVEQPKEETKKRTRTVKPRVEKTFSFGKDQTKENIAAMVERVFGGKLVATNIQFVEKHYWYCDLKVKGTKETAKGVRADYLLNYLRLPRGFGKELKEELKAVALKTVTL